MLDFAEHPLVDTEWLAQHLLEPDLRIVDARWRGDGSGRQRYLAGHIPGAVHIDYHLQLNRRTGRLQYQLVPPDQFAAVMEAAGIRDDSRVVLYAERNYSGATRLWWALRYHGHTQVAMLDGGITAWKAEGRPITTEEPEIRRARFTPRLQPQLLATADEIQAALGQPGSGVQIVDTRPAEQYAGYAVWTPEGSLFIPEGQETIEIGGWTMRGGRIPGARHLYASSNLDPATWRYRPPEMLRKLAQKAGLEEDKRLICYCGVGSSASMSLFALYLAGFRNLALYDASWEEWGTDPEKPIERDDTFDPGAAQDR